MCLPFGVNKHTDIILWLAERVTEPSCVDLWLLVGGNKPLQDVLIAGKKVEKSSHSRSIAGIKRPTTTVWLPLGVNKHTNMLLWLAERGNEPPYIEL